MGAFKYLSELWRHKQSDTICFLQRVRCWEYALAPPRCRQHRKHIWRFACPLCQAPLAGRDSPGGRHRRVDDSFTPTSHPRDHRPLPAGTASCR
jgi:hypothetical protein